MAKKPTNTKFALGTKVLCRSNGGHGVMIVRKVEYNTHERANFYVCEWQTDGKTHGQSYREDTLEAVK